MKNTYTQSKTAQAIASAASPSGTVVTHRAMLAANAKEESHLHPDGDVDVFFDNNQVVKKSTRMTVGGQPIEVAAPWFAPCSTKMGQQSSRTHH